MLRDALSLHVPVYQNAHVNSVCEKVYCIRCFFLFQQCSTVNIYKYKRKYVLKEFLMLLMDRNFNPFATCILIKQGHIINGNIPVALRCVTFFTHTSEPTSVLFSYKRASNYITDNQYFSLLLFWQIRYLH